MSLRTFTVFQDVPSTDSSKNKAAAIASIVSPTLSNKPLNINHATTLTTAEKENVHPLTGERAGPSNNPKKRKTSVLATKVHMPLSAKKQKDSTEPNPDVKKRKSSTASTAKGKAAVKKDGRSVTSSKKAVKKPSRRVLPMPKVEEEAERERERINQAEIDSRCYELTVKPLADLSQAYEQGASLETPTVDEDKIKFRSVKESSVEPEIRDYFSSPPQSSALPSASDAAPVEGRAFSTPERKQIYAAFTFTSPSPSSERFIKATRATSIPRLELV
ncbi:hypothetical protein D9615_008383 [Tricholomella constricta]|uniref:Uncharacterized protein n=1 Tax=Tricholomella constricta TaxID=117010 RepID=A0A8H5HDL2_9AGAR|nr:hypothetical protein D9615_008383 [Tricholomella constricta]